MTREELKAEERVNIRADLFAQHLQQKMPHARIMATEPYIFVFYENATVCVHAVAQGVFDLSGEIEGREEKIDRPGLSGEEVEHTLRQLYYHENPDELPTEPTWETETSTGDTQPTAEPLQKRELGENLRNRGRMLHTDGLYRHLLEILPDETTVAMDDAGHVNIISDVLKIRAVPKGGTFYDLETFIGEKREPKKTQVRLSDAVKYIFDAVMTDNATSNVVSNIGKVKKNKSAEIEPLLSDEDQEALISDAYSVLKELAVETGAYGGDDILRNKSLFDLRGLVLEKKSSTPQPFPTLREELAERFDRMAETGKSPLREETAPLRSRADNLNGGAPVSLNENRDVCRPYASTLGGKTLAMHPTKGAVLVDRSELKPGMKLSWDNELGAVMVPQTEETKRPDWRPYWQR